MSNNVSAVNLINIKRIGRRNNNLQWFKVPAQDLLRAERHPLPRIDMPDVHRVTIVTDATMTRLGLRRQDHRRPAAGAPSRWRCRSSTRSSPSRPSSTVPAGAELMRDFRPDTIIALGGGSPMDAAKVMWLLYEHPDVDFADLKEKFFDIRKRAFTLPDAGQPGPAGLHPDHLRHRRRGHPVRRHHRPGHRQEVPAGRLRADPDASRSSTRC